MKTKLYHEGLFYDQTVYPNKWPELLRTVLKYQLHTFTIRPFCVEIQKINPQTGETKKWAKEPGFSLWRDDTGKPSSLRKPRRSKKGWYISITGTQRFVSIDASSEVKAGFKVAGLHPKSDPKCARPAVGPFNKKEAEEIICQLNS